MYQPGEWRTALEQLCRDWIGRDPKSGTPYWLLGRQAVGDNRIEEAIRHLATACEKEPARADFCMALALAYMANSTPENLARARPWLEKAIALNPRSPGAHQHLGRLLEQTGDFTGARRQYLQSLDAAPAQPTALNNLARVVGRVSPPEVTRLFAGLAQDLREQGQQRSQLADRVYRQPNDAAAHLALARFLIRYGQLDAARSHLERATAASGAFAEARQALAGLERLLRVQAGT
jgi:Flp pilus assembly protein TadD